MAHNLNVVIYKSKFIDYLFWILFLIFINPGGIQNAFKINAIGGGLTLNDLIFPILFLCFILGSLNFKYDDDFKIVGFYFLIYLIYLFTIYGYVTPNLSNLTEEYSIIITIIKLRYAFYSISFFFFMYVFLCRSFTIFKNIFFIPSIIVLFLFIQSFISHWNFLPTIEYNRRFVKEPRLFLLSYGLMPLLIPIGSIALVFNYKGKHKIYILIGFLLMVITWVFALFRREFFGTIVYLVFSFLLYTFLIRTSISKLFKFLLKIGIGFILFVILLYQINPKYLNAAKLTFDNTLMVLGIKEANHKIADDPRLGLNKSFIVSKFIENPLLGTGFDNRWRTGKGDAQGYEAGDYPFLASLAMTGIIGLIFFLPIYFNIYKNVFFDLKYLRKNVVVNDVLIFLLSCLIILIYELFKYMDWFYPISVADEYYWFCIVSIYYATRRIYKEQILNNSNVLILDSSNKNND